MNVSAKFAVRIALVVLEIIAMAVFGVGLRTPYLLGEEEAVEGHWNVFVCDFL